MTNSINASEVDEAWGTYYPNSTIPLLAHPYIDALENFNPNLSSDPFAWIPKGLMEDLMDNTPGEQTVNDQVSGFTISQIFNAYQTNVTSVQQYKTTIINQNPVLPGNTTLAQFNNLFASYNF